MGGLVFLGAAVGLIIQLTEPFEGRRLAYAIRLIGPVMTMLIGGHLFLQRRAHPVFTALIAVLGSAIIVLFVLDLLGIRY